MRFRSSVVAGLSVIAAGIVLAISGANSASLEKAKMLRNNELSAEAKRELIELAFDANVPRSERAEALLLLGDIAIDESKPDTARENWSKVADEFAGEPAAAMASEKLTLLDKLSGSPKLDARSSPNAYMPGTVLVIGPEKYPWSIAQISGALGSYAVPFDGTLVQAMGVAKADTAVVALVEIGLSVDTAFESGRVVCQLPDGKKLWEEKVMFNLGGGEERIARRFVDGLSVKVKKRRCPAFGATASVSERIAAHLLTLARDQASAGTIVIQRSVTWMFTRCPTPKPARSSQYPRRRMEGQIG